MVPLLISCFLGGTIIALHCTADEHFTAQYDLSARKYTNTQIHKYTNTQIHKYVNADYSYCIAVQMRTFTDFDLSAGLPISSKG